MNKYSKIRTAEELEFAIHVVHTERMKLQEKYVQDLGDFREGLKPGKLVGTALKTVSPYLSWSEIGLGLVRGLKNAITPKNKKVSARDPERSGREGLGETSPSN